MQGHRPAGGHLLLRRLPANGGAHTPRSGYRMGFAQAVLLRLRAVLRIPGNRLLYWSGIRRIHQMVGKDVLAAAPAGSAEAGREGKSYLSIVPPGCILAAEDNSHLSFSLGDGALRVRRMAYKVLK